MTEQEPPAEGDADEGRIGADEGEEAGLGEWAARYEEERTRSAVKTIRFYPDEWALIEKRARRAGMAPAVYLRLRSIGDEPDVAALEAALGRYCALSERLLDLIVKNPVAMTHLAEAVRLRDELEEMHRAYCFHRRGEHYEPPAGIGGA